MVEPLAPGLRFEVVPPAAAPEPLRSDVAAFAGPTRRGPVGEPVRVEEWREYLRLFGGLVRGPYTPYAVRSYFENGGQVAWIVRLAGPWVATAAGVWPGPDGPPLPGHRLPDAASDAFLLNGDAVTRFQVFAATPGAWSENGRVTIRYRRQGAASGGPELDFDARFDGEPPEVLRALLATDAGELAEQVAALSRFVRLVPDAGTAVPPDPAAGPNRLEWQVTLTGGADATPRTEDYLTAVEAIGEQREIALVALPDLHRDLAAPAGASAGLLEASPAHAVLRAAIADAERRHDRLVLVDLPAGPDASDTLRALDELDGVLPDELERRAAAVYHPWLWVADPLGGTVAPRKLIPPSGPVAGLVSRLDRERGAHHTPANAALRDALDSAATFDAVLQGRFYARGLNLIRCFPNRGLQVWGGRTLGTEAETRFVAHRRLIHRLVRAIRRVAEPLVFEVEGPELWLTLVRGITTVLLEAFRAGALRGARPEEAFRVRCDEVTNPPAERELGRVLCEIDVAPAAPMEFITLRVALGRQGELEVFEP